MMDETKYKDEDGIESSPLVKRLLERHLEYIEG